MSGGEQLTKDLNVGTRKMMKYYRIDLYLGAEWEVGEKEFNRKIKSKWFLPVYDSYWQTFSEDTYYDCRDRIVRIFYQRRQIEE